MKVVPVQVELLDSMGCDVDVVRAARVSFSNDVGWEWAGAKDAKLIRYLAEHNHWSPFAHCFMKFRIKAPIFAARQFAKHQVGLAWNEESRRYIDSEPEFYIPEVFHGRPENAKQGASSDVVVVPDYDEYWQDYEGGFFDDGDGRNLCELLLGYYNHLLKAGVAPEEARMFLPLNTMTNWIWSGSLFAFARVVNLRTDSHAQKAATQEVAEQIATHLKKLFPVSYEALCGGTE